MCLKLVDDHELPPLPDFPTHLRFAEWPEPAETGLVDVTLGPLDFTPVPRRRVRRDGWTEQTQRLFILALSEFGCVSLAARAVGMSARTAYRLLAADGADSFAAAWDQAIARGIERLRADAFDRVLGGAWVPVHRKGRLVRVEHRRNDRLAIALLSGRDASIADNRERAVSRRKNRLRLAERDAAEAAEKARAEGVWAEHEALLEQIERDRVNRVCHTPPRIRTL